MSRLRLTNEYSTVMEIVTRYGGEQIIAGPVMDRMVNELTEEFVAERRAILERIQDGLDGLSLLGCDEVSFGDFDAILDAEAIDAV